MSSFLLHHFHQLPEAVHYIILDVLRGEAAVHLVEELAGTLDFGFLDLAQIHR